MSVPVSPAVIGRVAKAVLWVKAHWSTVKVKVLSLIQRWKDEPVKTTGYGVIAAVVAYFAAVGIVDSNVTQLVTSLVTLSAGAPVVHAVNTAVNAKLDKARALGRAESKPE